MSFNPLQIAQLDANIQHYAMALYERAGGRVQFIFDGSTVSLSDPELYTKCSKRASNKYTKQFKQGNKVEKFIQAMEAHKRGAQVFVNNQEMFAYNAFKLTINTSYSVIPMTNIKSVTIVE